MFNICFLDSITSKWRGQRSGAPQPQQQIMGASGTSSASESSSSLQRWVGDMSISQLWQDSIRFSFLVGLGETRRDCWVDAFLNFSGVDTSLCDFPLWIFRPFSDLDLKSHSSHWILLAEAIYVKATWMKLIRYWLELQVGITMAANSRQMPRFHFHKLIQSGSL